MGDGMVMGWWEECSDRERREVGMRAAGVS